jgi:hypothetical protein
MGCGSAGQQLKNSLKPRFVNAARIRHNVVHDEFNITASRCFDDVGFPLDARRRRRLRDTEAVRGRGWGWGWGGDMRQLLAARFPPESAAARVNNKKKHCAIWHESTHLQPAEVARHHARPAKRLAARRRPGVHVEAGGRGRKPMARHRRHTGHDARALRWPKRNLRVAEGWRRLAQLLASAEIAGARSERVH